MRDADVPGGGKAVGLLGPSGLSQAKNRHYLHADDVITATIATADGRIDLGEQRTPVMDAQ
ncbi:hypothetical protein ADK65_36660 [Streptomyces sp. NRRL B-1140]|nr:hypothetical protein ADK65_36660 [Streptomyces sp. NRRL B-1140]